MSDMMNYAKRLACMNIPSLSSAERVELECRLGVQFSESFHSLSDIADFEYIGGFDFISFPQGVISKTLLLRKEYKLTQNTIILLEEYESLILMKCFGDHEEVYWISNTDFYNYCEGTPLQSPYNRIFPTFTDFFEYLLTEEEKARELIPS